jgi:hypothetical protein
MGLARREGKGSLVIDRMKAEPSDDLLAWLEADHHIVLVRVVCVIWDANVLGATFAPLPFLPTHGPLTWRLPSRVLMGIYQPTTLFLLHLLAD